MYKQLKGGKKQTFITWEFWIIYIGATSLQLYSPPLPIEYVLDLVSSFQREVCGSRKIVRNLINITINKWSEMSSGYHVPPQYDVIQRVFHYHGVLSKNPWSQSNKEKTHQMNQNWNTYFKIPDQQYLKLSRS